MGLLIEGKWSDSWYETGKTGGRFVRQQSAFRGAITADGASGFAAEPGRYHLYVSLACPWAHRTLIMRQLKGLQDLVSVTVVDPRMGDDGWAFGEGGDPLYGARWLREIYTRADSGYTGRVTVPVLWDKQTQTIVCNESSEILRMLGREFDGLGARKGDYYPEALRSEIDAVNAVVYDTVNNGVYKAGFATTQRAYDEAVQALFETLDGLERRLGQHRYLAGDRLTEADLRLFTTLVRFDAVYHGHFKCNVRRLVDYDSLWAHTREIFQLPGVAATVDLEQIKAHYYWSHTTINPQRIIPRGPEIDFWAPHGRDRSFPAGDDSCSNDDSHSNNNDR